jgi:hydroxypyruvate isomerase
MTTLSRRKLLETSALGAIAAALPGAAAGQAKTARKGRIRQSVARWCYQKIALDDLCRAGAEMGLQAIDLLKPEEWEVPRKYGLICSMGYAGSDDIYNGLNRLENHDRIEAAFRQNIPKAAQLGVPNVITFSGARKGMANDQGANNTIIGLNRLKPIAEDHGVTICIELLNSKHDHPDYMCDHTAWGVSVVRAVNSPHVKLLYDIYHMQIMEGDLVETIQTNKEWIGHFHTGGVPGRHELDGTQEVRWDGVMRGIASTGYNGYVAHEFVPTGDPLTSLRAAVDLCDV